MKKRIKETTKEERIQIINELYKCRNGDCDNCGICKVFVGTSPLDVYNEYIEGIKELDAVSREFNEKRLKSLFR